jgi:hypothetical protein
MLQQPFLGTVLVLGKGHFSRKRIDLDQIAEIAT